MVWGVWISTINVVLILVLVEDSLWEPKQGRGLKTSLVLILVLVEDSLWDCKPDFVDGIADCVLILVLVEDSLWEEKTTEELSTELGLNPCFSGR